MPKDREVEVTHDVSAFVAELRRLADALESGSAFSIHVEGEEVMIPQDAVMSIAHEREDGEIELEFQLTWSEAASEDDDEEDEGDDDEDGDDEDVTEGDEPKASDEAVAEKA